MSISDGKVFLFGSKSRVIDVSDPSNPAVLDQYNLPSWVDGFRFHEQSFAVSGLRAYVLDNGFQAYDFSDPANPRHTGGVTCEAYDVAIADNYAFVASGDELLIFQIAGLPAPPALNAKRTASNVWTIRWPAHATDYQLFSSDDAGASWQAVVTAPGIDNGFFSVPMTIPDGISARLFQLKIKTP